MVRNVANYKMGAGIYMVFLVWSLFPVNNKLQNIVPYTPNSLELLFCDYALLPFVIHHLHIEFEHLSLSC